MGVPGVEVLVQEVKTSQTQRVKLSPILWSCVGAMSSPAMRFWARIMLSGMWDWGDPFQVGTHVSCCELPDCKPTEMPRPAVIRPTVSRVVCGCFSFGESSGSNESFIRRARAWPAE